MCCTPSKQNAPRSHRPLDEASNRMFKHVAITIAVVGTAMVVAAVLGY